MSFVLVDDSGKGQLCCSKSIDLERGCKNKCIGCYGTKTSLMGADKYYNHIVPKEFDEKKFRTSVKNTVRKGFKFARLGKHSDAANIENYDTLKSVLKITGEGGLRLVFVSKSLKFDKEIARLLRDKEHILHMSLGMISDAQSNEQRIKVYKQYRDFDIRAHLRITEDVTKPVPLYFKGYSGIITPMRFSSLFIANLYDVDMSKYEFVHGYYKPKVIDPSWSTHTNWCGEINGEIKCCKCMGE
jgi:hypothetical protein